MEYLGNKPLTRELSRVYFEGDVCKKILEQVFYRRFFSSTPDEDMIEKIDLKTQDKSIKAQVKTHESNKNYTIHSKEDYLNNDWVFFFERPITENMIETQFMNADKTELNLNAVKAYYKGTKVYMLASSYLKYLESTGKLVEMTAKNGDKYYLILKEDVEKYPFRFVI